MEGDPYHCHCQKTTRLLQEKLGWDKTEIRTTFQSKFGPEEWLKPYTVEEVRARLEQELERNNVTFHNKAAIATLLKATTSAKAPVVICCTGN